MTTTSTHPGESGANRSGRIQYVLPAAIVLFTLAIILIPLETLLEFSFRDGTPWEPGPLTLSNYVGAYGDWQTYQIFGNTLLLAVSSTALSIGVAIMFAFLTERTDLPYRNVAWALMLIPMAMPGLLFGVSWTILLSPRIGIFNVWMREFIDLFTVSAEDGPLNIYSVWGMIFLEGLRGVSTTFLIMVGAFRAMDPSLEESARTAGASNLTVFRRVTLPILTPVILAATVYAFMTHLESLEIPLIIGLPAKFYVFPTYIYFTTQRYTPPEYGLAAALSVAFIAVSILLVYINRRIVGQSGKFATVTGKGYRPRIIPLGRWRNFFFSIFIIYFVLTIAAPAMALLWSSFLPIPMAPSWKLLDSLTLRNYTDVFGEDDTWEGAWNTLAIGIMAATLTMLLALNSAWIIVRMRSKWSGFLDTVTFLPHAMPSVVIGVTLIILCLTPPFNQLHLYGTLTIVVIGMTISYLSFGSRTMTGAMSQIHLEMEEAAMTAGAKWRVIMQRIVLPLLLPAFISGWIWVATHAFRNFSVPVLLASRENKVLSVILWHKWDDGDIGQATALGVGLMAVLIVLTAGGRWLVVKVSRQQDA